MYHPNFIIKGCGLVMKVKSAQRAYIGLYWALILYKAFAFLVIFHFLT